MSSKEICLVDAGTGNLHSVENTLLALGARVIRVTKPDELPSGRRVVLPGVGAFGRFMDGLRADGLDQALLEVVQRGDPLLGICVGMQALFEVGEEMGEHAGLGLLSGRVAPFSSEMGLKIPHTGWNQLNPHNGGGPLFKSLLDGEYAYFNHSYYCLPAQSGDACALTDYGIDFASMVARDNILGVQFHPEKSQRVGLRILKNFLEN
ncbi:MAG: imidazole glycerol phosphate synthase subunit HisH [Anaerolineaceae bacterium]